MPTTATPACRCCRWWPAPTRPGARSCIYSLLLVPITFLPALVGTAGAIYAGVNVVLGAMFVYHAVKVYRLREGAEAEMACKKLFGFSILWLFMVFALILLEHAVGVPAFAPVTG